MIYDKQINKVQLYKKVNMSRQLFSKLKSDKDYHPTKNTVFLLVPGHDLRLRPVGLRTESDYSKYLFYLNKIWSNLKIPAKLQVWN